MSEAPTHAETEAEVGALPFETPWRRWWGEYEIPEGGVGRWRIGPLTLWAERRAYEWRLTSISDEVDPLATAERAVDVFDEPEETPPGARVDRIALGQVDGKLRLTPALADRPIVSRPDQPFCILPGEETRFYVGTPLWVQISTAQGLLLDLPTARPPDTWFGPSTISGELCYASRTQARLHLENVTLLPHRAVTKVYLRNNDDTPLLLERFNLPVGHLALYAARDDSLWTPSVRVRREREGQLAGLHIDERPPDQAGEVERLAPPRLAEDRSYLVRALSALLG